MKEWRISPCFLAVLVALPLAPPAIATTPRESTETLMIVVVDNAGLSQSEAAVMRRTMRTLLRYSGIRLECDWRSKSERRMIDPVRESAGVLPQIEIEIQANKPTQYKKDRLVLAMTTLGSNRATLHMAEIDRLNGTVSVGLGHLMGLAAIHEVGHILLGRTHSRWGAMTPRWGMREVDLMLDHPMPFSSAQSMALREEIRRRRVQLESTREVGVPGAPVVAADADGVGLQATPTVGPVTALPGSTESQVPVSAAKQH